MTHTSKNNINVSIPCIFNYRPKECTVRKKVYYISEVFI